MINLNKKILSGSFWLSFGSIFSRILGVVYLIPWLIMLGSYHNQLNAQAIFNSSYTPYALFLSVGTAGLPSVIAREVAALNSQKRYRDSVYLTKLGWLVMGADDYVTKPFSDRELVARVKANLRRQSATMAEAFKDTYGMLTKE